MQIQYELAATETKCDVNDHAWLEHKEDSQILPKARTNMVCSLRDCEGNQRLCSIYCILEVGQK